MAKNFAEGHDELPLEMEAVQGLWSNRTQFQNPKTGRWAKRDKETGQIIEVTFPLISGGGSPFPFADAHLPLRRSTLRR